MTLKKELIYYNDKTGDLTSVTKAQAKLLPPEYKKLKFTKNEDGTPVMRLTFTDEHGNKATIDVSESSPEEVAAHDNESTK